MKTSATHYLKRLLVSGLALTGLASCNAMTTIPPVSISNQTFGPTGKAVAPGTQVGLAASDTLLDVCNCDIKPKPGEQ